MLLRFAQVCLVALSLAVFNGCCSYPMGCGEAAVVGGCGVSGCGVGGCDQCGGGAAPCQLGCVADQATNHLTCGAGCGEVYWGEWINDPPAKCDPCDHHGTWIGEVGCGSFCNLFAGLPHLWGYRYASMGCDTGSCGGCDACGGKGAGDLPFESVVPGPEGDDMLAPTPEPPEPTPDTEASARARVRHAGYQHRAPF